MQAALLAAVRPLGPAASPASIARWNSPLWNRTQASSAAASGGRGSASPACKRLQCRRTEAASNWTSPRCGKAVHLAIRLGLLSAARSARLLPVAAVSARQLQQMLALRRFQIGYQQMEHMVGSAQQGLLRTAWLQGV